MYVIEAEEMAMEAVAQVGLGGELARLADELERTRWSAVVCDPDWMLVWASSEAKRLWGDVSDAELGYGRHVAHTFMGPWRSIMSPDSFLEQAALVAPYFCHRLGRDALGDLMGPEFEGLIEHVEPASPPPLWVSSFDYRRSDLPVTRINYLAFRYEVEGREIGWVIIFGSNLPASLLDLVARGDEAMFERMARLISPGQHETAILFADLDSSSLLSRTLPSAVYFELLREITTSVDATIAEHSGIVGKHGGDGVTALFLADEFGSPSAAAKAAVGAAISIRDEAQSAARRLSEFGAPVDPQRCLMNVGLHWGPNLYIGQIVTGGRLEVTALGDEVNECARLQESAQDGEILISKMLVERVDDADADELGLEKTRLAYTRVSDLPDAPPKAVRDAGNLPVARVTREDRDQVELESPAQGS